MDPLIDLAPGAEENPLAKRLVALIKESIETDPSRRRSFLALKSTVLVVPFDTGDALTLRFDLGKLAVHDGNIGVPSVTLGVPTADLRALSGLRMPALPDLGSFVERLRGRDRSYRASGPPSARQKRGVVDAARLFASGEVKVYGLVAHPRTVYRLLRLLSPPSVARSVRGNPESGGR